VRGIPTFVDAEVEKDQTAGLHWSVTLDPGLCVPASGKLAGDEDCGHDHGDNRPVGKSNANVLGNET
jgi:hypothetical protein